MPYIITTTGPRHVPFDNGDFIDGTAVTRTAVATLDEARAAAKVVIDNLPPDHSDRDWSEHYAAAMLLNSGGTIGPLPDGTVIEVRPVEAGRLAIMAPGCDSWREDAIIAHFNAHA